MSYIDNHLLTGESIRYRTRLHWRVYLIPLLLDVLFFVPLIVWALLSDMKLLALIPFSAALVVITGIHLYRVSSEFAVTNKRVIVKLGMLSTRSVELLLPKIEAISVSQTVMGRLFGYGEIVVIGSGGTRETFAGIQSPLAFRQAVQAAADPPAAHQAAHGHPAAS
jgi:uncharacterized membrane protein YdbT with pleckstrin-like domain